LVAAWSSAEAMRLAERRRPLDAVRELSRARAAAGCDRCPGRPARSSAPRGDMSYGADAISFGFSDEHPGKIDVQIDKFENETLVWIRF
jgi:hypothetical protein